MDRVHVITLCLGWLLIIGVGNRSRERAVAVAQVSDGRSQTGFTLQVKPMGLPGN